MTADNAKTDVLPLLAYKIAPRQFDVSYRVSNISIRDQIVRAQMLVRTLFEMGLVHKDADESGEDFQLLICGAGAAGLAAAKEATELGISFVLIERCADVPGGILQSKASRYVSTAMYEWPHPNHANHDYPLAKPRLLGEDSPLRPASLAMAFSRPVLIEKFGEKLKNLLVTDIKAWERNYVNFLAQGGGTRQFFFPKTILTQGTKDRLRDLLKAKVSIHGTPLHAAKPLRVKFQTTQNALANQKWRFQYIIYAVGFAKEAMLYASQSAQKNTPYIGYEHKGFWDVDKIPRPNLGFNTKPPSVAILGSGDGALQDSLRCLVNPKIPHPLAIWDHLMRYRKRGGLVLGTSRHIKQALSEVAAADSYTTGGAVWTSKTHIYASLDATFRDIISRMLKREGRSFLKAVDSIIRTDVEKVTIVNQDGHFSKAYALNRFLVLLIEEVLKKSKIHAGKLEILSGSVSNFESIVNNSRGARLSINLKNTQGMLISQFDLVIIRGGLDKTPKGSPTQLVGLSKSGKDAGRAELGRIPPPIRPFGLT